MKQTLHWNVSGIPPEARDAARAAATKEGLTVGDWLTRRILADRAASSPSGLHGERNGTEPDAKPLGPRLVRIENEPDPAFRRVDEALRVLSMRIEVSERAHNEAQRTLGTVAADIQAASRDQAEAFARFAERIDRVEKNADSAPLRDALRGLHQGVARLTEQVAKTASDSAGQVGVLASSVEAMAVKVASVRDESVRLERMIQERLDALSERVRQLEERIQAGPVVQQALEARIDSTESRMREDFSQRLAEVERNFGAMAARREDADKARGQGQIQESIATLNRRLETAERRSKDAMAALQSNLSDASARISRLEDPVMAGPAAARTTPPIESGPPQRTDAAGIQKPTPGDFETPVPTARAEGAGTSEYLAQARRAAQAAADPAGSSAWPMMGTNSASGTRERSRVARVVTQAFFLLLVMSIGFLLMQYFGPQPDTRAVRSAGGAVGALPTPELRALEAKANQGVAVAELLLGLKYADGDGVEVDDEEAALWLGRAAEKGEGLAQYRLGTLYEKGLGVPADRSLAADWYAKAAERGNIKAMHNLAVAYANGAGREENFSEAARWFRSAAERGLADSQFNLAVLHERGLGVPTSLSEAYRWYAIAAAQGDSESDMRVEALTSQIPAAERDAADKAAEAFKAVPADPEANQAPQLAQILN